jgi:hypothetical protein
VRDDDTDVAERHGDAVMEAATAETTDDRDVRSIDDVSSVEKEEEETLACAVARRTTCPQTLRDASISVLCMNAIDK